MKIFITGGTGFIGKNLIKTFLKEGHNITLLTRSLKNAKKFPAGVELLQGDPTKEGMWQSEISGHDIIVNLAGFSIFKRWSSSVKKEIYDSRILTTKNIVKALEEDRGKVKMLLSASAIGIYGYHEGTILTENDTAGDDFLAVVTRDWENEALNAEKHGVSVALLRFGVVLGKNGGAFKNLSTVFKSFIGSRLGNGKQWFSWIHEHDLDEMIIYIIKNSISGPINFTAPNPVTNKEMTSIFLKAFKRPPLLPPVPSFAIKLLLGEFGGFILKGQKVMPKKIIDAGYKFKYLKIEDAVKDLIENG